MDYDEETLLELIAQNDHNRAFYEGKLAELRAERERSMTTTAVGQVWADLDMRNAKVDEDGNVQPRTIRIERLATDSRVGVVVVLTAPNNERSVGQVRPYTEGKLRAHYSLVGVTAEAEA